MTGPDLGPFRPHHVRDGWRLEGDHRGEWSLVLPAGNQVAQIRATGTESVSWTVYASSGAVVREASAVSVEAAQEHAWRYLCGERINE
ncbi:hypothetical protein [Nocardia sp. alder85J]|uniref:hypothetical protein n=1 Tax=Nocardia sp. alder85J TaxID=2862949 RepID=UPI001CD39AED|nr:hypothetical protein [Nocardia sp. alder85J]MCX4095332.1 hypothetical protein [Nocardia sp. alder85J]